MHTSINLNLLDYHWSATVKLNGGQTIDIWWTSWHSIKKYVKEIITVSSDLPKCEIQNSKFIIK